jgi:1,4-alpha-glucan branching enzyme
MGCTHLELLPIAEHPFDDLGYQMTGDFAPTASYGSPEDLMYFINCCHTEVSRVIIDWVLRHFLKDAYGLARFDRTTLYEHEEPRKGEHKQWGTLIFNYGCYEVRNFLISNALFWFEKYHIDGIRVDAVAPMRYLDNDHPHGEWVPNPSGGRENLEAIDFFKSCTNSNETWAGSMIP